MSADKGVRTEGLSADTGLQCSQPRAAFTPGPWVVEDPLDFELSIVANGQSASPADWTVVASCTWPDEDDHDITSREVKANARLIAAAPDLCEAADHAARTGAYIDDDMVLISGGAYRLLCVAVAKATGGQP